MKKLLIFLLAMVTALAVTACNEVGGKYSYAFYNNEKAFVFEIDGDTCVWTEFRIDAGLAQTNISVLEKEALVLSGTLTDLGNGEYLLEATSGYTQLVLDGEAKEVEEYRKNRCAFYEQMLNNGFYQQDYYDELIARMNGEKKNVVNEGDVYELTFSVKNNGRVAYLTKAEAKSGKYEGTWTTYEYRSDGSVEKETRYQNGEMLLTIHYDEHRNDYYSGADEHVYYPNGMLKSTTIYSSGNIHMLLEYNDKGKLIKETEYYSDGTARTVYFYTDGIVTADRVENYDKNGKLGSTLIRNETGTVETDYYTNGNKRRELFRDKENNVLWEKEWDENGNLIQ